MTARTDRPTAAETADKIISILECLKQYDLVKTITADNGLQFAEHERVTEATDVGFFFASTFPRAPTSRTSRRSSSKK